MVDVESDRLMHHVGQIVGKSLDEVQETVYHKELLKEFELGKITPEDYYRGLQERLKLPWTFAQFVQFWNDILIEKKDSTAVIARLHGRCKLSVLSNTNILHMGYMKAKISVLSRFGDVVGSYEIGACKPDPRSYQIVLERSGVAPEQAVYVDDRPEMVEGARGVGLCAIRFEQASQLERDLRGVGLLDG